MLKVKHKGAIGTLVTVIRGSVNDIDGSTGYNRIIKVETSIAIVQIGTRLYDVPISELEVV